MKLEKQLILNTEVTKNNRRYNMEVLESIRDQINNPNRNNRGTMGYPESTVVELNKVGFSYSNAVVENESLYCCITILETPTGESIKSLLEDLVFRPVGQATIKGEMPVETLNLLKVPNVVNTDYSLVCISAISKSDDAVNY
jgi:hypothetical protein